LAEATPAPLRVLAVAESDAYLKWAAWTLHRARPAWDGTLSVLRSPIGPSARQVVDALSGTSYRPADVIGIDLIGLRRRLRHDPVDVLVLACTGPSILAIGAVSLPKRGPARPVVVSGLPGVALPIHRRAIRARRDTDLFVAHSIRERGDYQRAFGAERLPVRVALATLPFLTDGNDRGGSPDGPVVFAAQPSVPPERDERIDLLRRLAALSPPAPIVKLRAEDAEMATHNEPWPYPQLWRELVERHEVGGDELEFLSGPLEPVLDRARCLVTVSSTAALEAIARGVPVLIVDHLGVDERLLNGIFGGSGLFGALDDKGVGAAAPPDAAWREHNYLHGHERDDLLDQIADVARGTSSISAVPRRGLPTAWITTRRTIRLLTARRTA
jgi:Putative glycosyltransferase (DUF6716)